MSTPRVGCRYVFEPVLFDAGIFPKGVTVTVVPMPGMAHAKVPSKFRYVEYEGRVSMVFSASLKPRMTARYFGAKRAARTRRLMAEAIGIGL